MNAHEMKTKRKKTKKKRTKILNETKQSQNVQKLNINYNQQQFQTNNITLYATNS